MLQPLADPSPLGCVDGMDRILTADQAQSKALYVASTPFLARFLFLLCLKASNA